MELRSGFPLHKHKGFILLNFEDGINSDYLTENGELGILYADINQGRLPYHRLDIALKKEHKISKISAFNWNLGVTNVYDRANIFYFNRIKYERVNQLL